MNYPKATLCLLTFLTIFSLWLIFLRPLTDTSSIKTKKEHATVLKKTTPPSKTTDITNNQTLHSRTPQHDTPETIGVTVFVHGIVGLKPHLTPANLIRLMLDQVENTTYAKAVEIERNTSIFYTEQAMQTLGLQPISLDCTPGNASGATAHVFQKIDDLAYPLKKHKELFFTFGWSGLSSRTAREIAGIELYHALEHKVHELRKQGFSPKIRVIGYSHGGNVVLNIGAAHPLDYQNHTFIIDQLVLLGTPIQFETDYLVQSKIFKDIYHIYSYADRVQELECFSYKRFFSNKLFKPRADFQLPDNLHQIKIRVTDLIKQKKTKRTIHTTHPHYILGTAPYLRDRSPGHLELWRFAWTNNFRKHNTLNPLPLVVFIPYILNAFETYPTKINPTESLIVDFRPRLSHIIVRPENNFKDYLLLPTINVQTIQDLGLFAQCYTNNTINLQEELTKNIQQACSMAYDLTKGKRKSERCKKQTQIT